MLTPGTATVAQHYDRVVGAWSLLLGRNLHYGCFDAGAETLEEATERLTDRLIERLTGRLPRGSSAIGPGSRVLDVGCGTGAPAARVARRLGCAVIGVAPSESCIELALRSRPPELATLLDFQLGDAQALPFADGSFDAAWIMESSHLVPDKARLFGEARRVLMPGARLALCDVALREELTLPEVIAMRDDLLLLNVVFGRTVLKTPRYYVEEAQRQGFVDIAVEDLSVEVGPTFDHWERNARLHREEVVRRFGEPSWSDFLAAAALLRGYWERGVLGYFSMGAIRR